MSTTNLSAEEALKGFFSAAEAVMNSEKGFNTATESALKAGALDLPSATLGEVATLCGVSTSAAQYYLGALEASALQGNKDGITPFDLLRIARKVHTTKGASLRDWRNRVAEAGPNATREDAYRWGQNAVKAASTPTDDSKGKGKKAKETAEDAVKRLATAASHVKEGPITVAAATLLLAEAQRIMRLAVGTLVPSTVEGAQEEAATTA